MVAHQPSKLVVAGSSPVSRSLAPEMGLLFFPNACRCECSLTRGLSPDCQRGASKAQRYQIVVAGIR